MKSSYPVTHLRPKNRDIILHDGSEVTVPVFDAKSMILDLLTNKITMDNANIAEGYNVFTGHVDDDIQPINNMGRFTPVMRGCQHATDFATPKMRVTTTCLLD
jgi:hypothetical protein